MKQALAARLRCFRTAHKPESKWGGDCAVSAPILFLSFAYFTVSVNVVVAEWLEVSVPVTVMM